MRISRKAALSATAVIAAAASLTAHPGMPAAGGHCGTAATASALADTTAEADGGQAICEQSVVDGVVWVVGDEPILKSEVEVMRLQAAMEGIKLKGDPDCAIPEMLAVQKLYLHQADKLHDKRRRGP